MRSRIASMHERDDTKKVVPRAHLLKAARQAVPNDAFNSGGAGLISSAEDYSREYLVTDVVTLRSSPTLMSYSSPRYAPERWHFAYHRITNSSEAVN
jgi:hypothetical protein